MHRVVDKVSRISLCLSVIGERPVSSRLNVCKVEFNTVGTNTGSGGSGGSPMSHTTNRLAPT